MDNDFMLAEVKAIYSMKQRPSEMLKVSKPGQVYQAFLQSWDLGTIDYLETFKVMFLNNGNRVLGIQTIGIGGLCGVAGDLRVVFASALSVGATSVVLCHNHPSGQMIASEADKRITDKFIQAGLILDIPVLDHFIITDSDFICHSDNWFHVKLSF